MACYALSKRNLNVCVVDSNRRRSEVNARAVYQEFNFPNDNRLFFKTVNSEKLETNNSVCFFESATQPPRRTVSVDILILLVRDDANIDNLEQYIATVKHKQLVVLGNGENSKWLCKLRKLHWLDVIQ
jgi:hypothetical protein